MWTRRFLIAALLAAAPLAGGCGGAGEAKGEPAAQGPAVAAEPAATPVRSVAVAPEAVTAAAVLSADLLPARRATLAAEVTGSVEAVDAEIGQRVAAGQVLARIDTRALKQQVAEAEALFRQAEDRVGRAEKLFARRSITDQQRSDARAAYDVAEARLSSARLALEKSQLRAPWSGQVARRLVEVGDFATPGQPLVELVQVDRLKAWAPAPAADVPYLRLGAPVAVRVDVLGGERFDGRIVHLGAELDSGTRSLDIEVELPNPGGRLKPGMFGRMEVPLRDLPAALLVPIDAVVELERERAIYVVAGGRASLRRVELGPIIGARVVIAAGLAPGERVIVAGHRQVADGQPVVEADGGTAGGPRES